MSGALRKMSNFLGYSEPEEEAYTDEYSSESDAYDSQATAGSFADHLAGAGGQYQGYDEAAAAAGDPDLRRIVTVHPSTYNEARIIGESFRDGVPVIINLTHMSESEARRMVDFSAGLIFGLRGDIEQITPRVFVLTPASVKLDAGDADQQTDRGRFFNQS